MMGSVPSLSHSSDELALCIGFPLSLSLSSLSSERCELQPEIINHSQLVREKREFRVKLAPHRSLPCLFGGEF